MDCSGYRFKYVIVDINEQILEYGLEWEESQLMTVVKGEHRRLRKWSDMEEETFVLTMREPRALSNEGVISIVPSKELSSYRFIILWMVAEGDFKIMWKDSKWHDSEKKAREMSEKYLKGPRDVIDGLGKDAVIIQERIEASTIRYRFL